MEIRFIWIQEYRGIIENLNINFNHSGKHRFNYSGDLLELQPNSVGPLSFGKKIKGITAIAGKNGSGKSSICEVILNAAATYINGSWGWNHEFKGIVCYGKRIFYSKELEINNKHQILESGYELKDFEESPFEKLPVDWKLEFHKGSFIYYSNVLDWRSDIELTNLINISTQYLLSHDYRTGTAIVPDFKRRDDVPDILNSYYNNQGYRNLKFYLKFADNIPFADPKVFALKSSYSALNKFLNFRNIGEYEEYSPFDGLEREILGRIQSFEGPIKPGEESKQTNIQQAKEGMMNLYRFNLLMALAVNNRIFPDVQRASNFVLGITDDFDLFTNSAKVQRLIQAHEQLVSFGEISDKFSADYLHRQYPDYNWKFFIIEHLWITNSEESRKLLTEFMTLEEEILRGDRPYLKRISDYSVHPWFSTGENAYYMLFSRLFDTLNRLDIGDDEREDLVLFIDEGESGFHPAWKKRFLKWMIDFLNEDYNKYNFQIILTTHSPYILSDLTSEHTILLKRDEGKTTEIIPSDSYRTFGANINELLADAFFLTDGQIGEFAKQEIQKVINQLNQWRRIKSAVDQGQKFEVEQSAKKECREVIESIGDVIVRKKLLEMYLEIFEDEGIVDQEILFLEDRIKQLRERKNK